MSNEENTASVEIPRDQYELAARQTMCISTALMKGMSLVVENLMRYDEDKEIVFRGLWNGLNQAAVQIDRDINILERRLKQELETNQEIATRLLTLESEVPILCSKIEDKNNEIAKLHTEVKHLKEALAAKHEGYALVAQERNKAQIRCEELSEDMVSLRNRLQAELTERREITEALFRRLNQIDEYFAKRKLKVPDFMKVPL